MRRWQRSARLIIAAFGIVFAAFVARQLKPREAPKRPAPITKTDPGAAVEATGGTGQKFSKSREDVSIDYEHQYAYQDGTSRLVGVRIVVPERSGGRTFTITGKEGRIGNKESSIQLDGAVRLEASDGMTALTEHATYSDADGVVHAPGPVEFSRGQMRGTGIGLSWDKRDDVLTILDRAIIHVLPDDHGAGAAAMTAGNAAFARREKIVRLDRGVRIERSGQIIEAANATAYMTADEQRIDTIELREHARVTAAKAAAGALKALTGQQMNLKYAADGESLEHALVAGQAVIQMAGDPGKPGRQIAAETLDISLAADGSTPTALLGREKVLLTFPAEPGVGARTVQAVNLECKGEEGKGLTRAHFTGNVQYREVAGAKSRAVNAGSLDAALKPGMSGIGEANFSQAVHFEEGTMGAMAAVARYDVDKGLVALSGSEPGAAVPHVVNDKIVVDAVGIDLTLEGPKMKATGTVKSHLKPPPNPKPGEAADVKMPAMLKQDQDVFVAADTLDYDGTIARALYSGKALLFQGDTTIKGDTIEIDNKAGNLAASGGVTTTTVLETTDTAKVDKAASSAAAKATRRAPSIATAKDLKYADTDRRLTYTGDAHMSGPEGDMTAARIVLFLKPSGDELERAEAYENLTLREQNRETKGATLVYTTSNETYVVTGAPVKIVDQCERETVGRTLTFNKGTDSIVVDGNSQIRTQTKGGNGKCTS